MIGGDGIIDNYPSHTYSDLKSERIIKVIDPSSIPTIERSYSNWTIEVLNIGNTSKNYNNNLHIMADKISCKIPKNIKRISFKHSRFTEIPKYLFEDKPNLNTLDEMFYYCTNLRSLPNELFKPLSNLNITSMYRTFTYCKDLEQIPEDLLSYFPSLNSAKELFRECYKISNIPSKLFSKNPNITELDGFFMQCSEISSIPEGLFKNTTLTDTSYTFRETAITNLPADLFGGNTRELHKTMFYETKLKTIHSNCLKNASRLDYLRGTFQNQTELTEIPEDLLKFNTNLRYADELFKGCSKLRSIPNNLFINNTKLENISSIFEECSNIDNIPANLLSNTTSLVWASNSFKNCNKLLTIPQDIINKLNSLYDASHSFQGCTNANNYTTIPAKLK